MMLIPFNNYSLNNLEYIYYSMTSMIVDYEEKMNKEFITYYYILFDKYISSDIGHSIKGHYKNMCDICDQLNKYESMKIMTDSINTVINSYKKYDDIFKEQQNESDSIIIEKFLNEIGNERYYFHGKWKINKTEGHVIALNIIKNEDDTYDLAFGNIGDGVQYTGIINISNKLTICNAINIFKKIPKDKIVKFLNGVLFTSKNVTSTIFFYEYVLINIIDYISTNEQDILPYGLQSSGSCTFFAIFLNLYFDMVRVKGVSFNDFMKMISVLKLVSINTLYDKLQLGETKLLTRYIYDCEVKNLETNKLIYNELINEINKKINDKNENIIDNDISHDNLKITTTVNIGGHIDYKGVYAERATTDNIYMDIYKFIKKINIDMLLKNELFVKENISLSKCISSLDNSNDIINYNFLKIMFEVQLYNIINSKKKYIEDKNVFIFVKNVNELYIFYKFLCKKSFTGYLILDSSNILKIMMLRLISTFVNMQVMDYSKNYVFKNINFSCSIHNNIFPVNYRDYLMCSNKSMYKNIIVFEDNSDIYSPNNILLLPRLFIKIDDIDLFIVKLCEIAENNTNILYFRGTNKNTEEEEVLYKSLRNNHEKFMFIIIKCIYYTYIRMKLCEILSSQNTNYNNILEMCITLVNMSLNMTYNIFENDSVTYERNFPKVYNRLVIKNPIMKSSQYIRDKLESEKNGKYCENKINWCYNIISFCSWMLEEENILDISKYDNYDIIFKDIFRFRVWEIVDDDEYICMDDKTYTFNFDAFNNNILRVEQLINKYCEHVKIIKKKEHHKLICMVIYYLLSYKSPRPKNMKTELLSSVIKNLYEKESLDVGDDACAILFTIYLQYYSINSNIYKKALTVKIIDYLLKIQNSISVNIISETFNRMETNIDNYNNAIILKIILHDMSTLYDNENDNDFLKMLNDRQSIYTSEYNRILNKCASINDKHKIQVIKNLGMSYQYNVQMMQESTIYYNDQIVYYKINTFTIPLKNNNTSFTYYTDICYEEKPEKTKQPLKPILKNPINRFKVTKDNLVKLDDNVFFTLSDFLNEHFVYWYDVNNNAIVGESINEYCKYNMVISNNIIKRSVGECNIYVEYDNYKTINNNNIHMILKKILYITNLHDIQLWVNEKMTKMEIDLPLYKVTIKYEAKKGFTYDNMEIICDPEPKIKLWELNNSFIIKDNDVYKCLLLCVNNNIGITQKQYLWTKKDNFVTLRSDINKFIFNIHYSGTFLQSINTDGLLMYFLYAYAQNNSYVCKSIGRTILNTKNSLSLKYKIFLMNVNNTNNDKYNNNPFKYYYKNLFTSVTSYLLKITFIKTLHNLTIYPQKYRISFDEKKEITTVTNCESVGVLEMLINTIKNNKYDDMNLLDVSNETMYSTLVNLSKHNNIKSKSLSEFISYTLVNINNVSSFEKFVYDIFDTKLKTIITQGNINMIIQKWKYPVKMFPKKFELWISEYIKNDNMKSDFGEKDIATNYIDYSLINNMVTDTLFKNKFQLSTINTKRDNTIDIKEEYVINDETYKGYMKTFEKSFNNIEKVVFVGNNNDMFNEGIKLKREKIRKCINNFLINTTEFNYDLDYLTCNLYLSKYENIINNKNVESTYNELKMSTMELSIEILYFQALFGNIIRAGQYELINNILKNISSDNKQFYHMLMGEGKSSVIIPIICMSILNNKKYNNIVIVLPEHLVNQVYNNMANIFNQYYSIDIKKELYDMVKINIISDRDLKFFVLKVKNMVWLYNNNNLKNILESLKNCFYIYDEVDDIINPIKSECNLPYGARSIIDNGEFIFDISYGIINGIMFNENKKNKLYNENKEVISIDPHFHISNINKKNDFMEKVYDMICDILINNSIIKKMFNKDSLLKIIKDPHVYDYSNKTYDFFIVAKIVYKIVRQVLPEVLCNIHKKNYGISKNKNYAIPFIAVNTPAETSEFSDYLYTVFYTIISYKIEHLNGKVFSDYVSYIKQQFNAGILSENQKNTIFQKVFDTKNTSIYKMDINDVYIFVGKSKNIGKDDTDENYINEGKKTLFSLDHNICDVSKWVITTQVTLNIKQLNISSYDIISSIFSNNKTGFTGTPFIPEIFDIDKNKEMRKIEARPYDIGNILRNLYGLYKKNDVFCIQDNFELNEIVNILINNKYTCLIDVGAILLKYKSKKIITAIKEKYGGFDYYVHIKNGKPYYIGKDNKSITYDNDKSNIFVYFDQKHITGIDIKQSDKAKALVTLRRNTGFRDVAQGVFRMRRLLNGQTIALILMTSDEKGDLNNIVNMIISNDSKVHNIQRRLGMLQNIRTMGRDIISLYNAKNTNITETNVKLVGCVSLQLHRNIKKNIYENPYVVYIYNNVVEKKSTYITQSLFEFNKVDIWTLLNEFKGNETYTEKKIYILKLFENLSDIDTDIISTQEQEKEQEKEQIGIKITETSKLDYGYKDYHFTVTDFYKNVVTTAENYKSKIISSSIISYVKWLSSSYNHSIYISINIDNLMRTIYNNKIVTKVALGIINEKITVEDKNRYYICTVAEILQIYAKHQKNMRTTFEKSTFTYYINDVPLYNTTKHDTTNITDVFKYVSVLLNTNRTSNNVNYFMKKFTDTKNEYIIKDFNFICDNTKIEDRLVNMIYSKDIYIDNNIVDVTFNELLVYIKNYFSVLYKNIGLIGTKKIIDYTNELCENNSQFVRTTLKKMCKKDTIGEIIKNINIKKIDENKKGQIIEYIKKNILNEEYDIIVNTLDKEYGIKDDYIASYIYNMGEYIFEAIIRYLFLNNNIDTNINEVLTKYRNTIIKLFE